jgi:asparagine synthase (glutamine-hydrolysing)
MAVTLPDGIATLRSVERIRSAAMPPATVAAPAHLKVRGQEKKWILREAMRGWLPDDILDRPKQGFSVPLSDWLRGDLKDWARDILLDRETLGRGYFEPAAVRGILDRHAAGIDGEAKRVWALLTLELWHREFVGAPSADQLAPAA